MTDYPLLTKERVRRHPESLYRTDLADHQWTRHMTSGSTGEAVQITWDADALAWFEATVTWYLGQFVGMRHWRMISSSNVRLWHRHQRSRASSSLRRQLAQFLSPSTWLEPVNALSEDCLLTYAGMINQAKPVFIWTYPGVLYELCKTAMRRNIRLHKPRFIISSAETLHPFMRQVIEDTFGCRVYNLYGSTETGYVAGECCEGNLHTFSFVSKVEVLSPTGQSVPPGEEGRLVLTPLHNYAMPLIRYDTADVAQVGPEVCGCGCQLPTLSRISGRTVEFFITSNGSLVSGGRLMLSMRLCEWILSFQILQREIDRITIFFTRMADSVIPNDEVERMTDEMTHVMGRDCRIDWQEVEEIPRTPNGKRPYARSLVWEAKLPVDLWDET